MTEPSTAVATRAPRNNVEQVCMTIARPDFKQRIASALPPGIDPERFQRVVLTAIQQNPAVANADKNSLYNAVIRCAQDGLLPNGKEAAIVQFGNQAQYMPMIGGLRKIAADHGIIMATGVVHKNDHFDYELGVKPYKVHKPAALDQDRGDAIGAWAEAMDRNGNLYLEVMGKQDIEAVRSVSRAKGGDLWTKWWGEAARKTVGRRLFKSLPLADELDERESRIIEAADAEFSFAPATAEPADTSAQAASAAASGPRRPRGLDKVAAAASGQQRASGDVIEGESERIDTHTGEVTQADDAGPDRDSADSHATTPDNPPADF